MNPSDEKTCACDRCGRRCQVSRRSNPESVLIRHSLVPKGCCVDCAITCFIKTGPLAQVTGGAWTAPGFKVGEALSLPHVQQQFLAVFIAAKCAAVGTEINWDRVIMNWELPVPDGWDWKGESYMSSGNKRRGKR